jgi:acylphosphatase
MDASMENLEMRTVRVLITGRVQGVAYRVWTERTAKALGLRGWVRNRRDGAVEALFSGARASVDDMLRRCRVGPSAAKVSGVSVAEDGGQAPQAFEILPTV